MAKPSIIKISPFDPREAYTVSFMWNGERAYKNRLIISNASTLKPVWDNTVTSFLLQHTIPANTLRTGQDYYAEVITYSYDGTPSTISDKMFFIPLDRPTFYFSGLSSVNKNTIDNASFGVSCYYSQPNYDLLKNYRFYIYDISGSMIGKSEEMYDSKDISYVYKGLETSTTYYIQCKGCTQAGVVVETPRVELWVYYQNPSDYALFFTKNVGNRGYIKYDTNIKLIQYNGDETFDFIKNAMIDLRGKSITYDDGFTVSGDFTCTLQGCYLWRDGDVALLKDTKTGATIRLTSSVYPQDNGKRRYKLISTDGYNTYTLYSEPVEFKNFDIVSIQFRRISNFFDISIKIVGEFWEDSNMWFATTTDERVEVDDGWLDVNGFTFIPKDRINVTLQKDLPTNPTVETLWFGSEV